MSKFDNLNLIRSSSRPTGKALAYELFPDLCEFKGDRLYGEDSAIVCGIGTLFDMPITVVAQNKGSDFEERVENNFGMAHPEGYRKAERMFKQAEKFGRPIVTIVDTAGAYPGIESEERGQASAIASCLSLFLRFFLPSFFPSLIFFHSYASFITKVFPYPLTFNLPSTLPSFLFSFLLSFLTLSFSFFIFLPFCIFFPSQASFLSRVTVVLCSLPSSFSACLPLALLSFLLPPFTARPRSPYIRDYVGYPSLPQRGDKNGLSGCLLHHDGGGTRRSERKVRGIGKEGGKGRKE